MAVFRSSNMFGGLVLIAFLLLLLLEDGAVAANCSSQLVNQCCPAAANPAATGGNASHTIQLCSVRHKDDSSPHLPCGVKNGIMDQVRVARR